MKNISLIINVVLLLAVSYLFFHIFGKSEKPAQASAGIPSAKSTTLQGAVIAYVDLDSLNENIKYIKDKRKDLEAEQKAIESEWQSGMNSLTAKRDNFVKRGNSITQAEAEKFQEELMAGQQSVEQKKQNSSSKLSEKSYRFMDDIQTKLKDFLKEYNQEKGYTYILTTGTGLDYMIYRDSTLNITADVIKGMNTKMEGLK